MSTNVISGANFKKMLQHASHTKGYLSEKVKKELRATTLSSGGHASKVLHDDHARVHKRDAIKIIKKLKDEHMAHGVTTSAEKFVSTAIHHQQAVEESIARQRKDDRVKELAQAHAAETAKGHNQAAKSGHSAPPKAVSLAAHSVAAVQHQPAATSTGMHHVTTPFKHLPGHTAEAEPTNTNISPGGAIHNPKPSEEAIDLAID